MSGTGRLILLIILRGIPLIALPVDAVGREIVVETFPPDGIVIEVMRNVREDGIAHGGMESVRVRMLVRSGSNAEEAVLGVDRPESSVLADTEPCDVVADAPCLIALLLIDLGRDQHGKVGLAAGRGERRGDVLDLSLGILDAEDEHMLCHPAFLASEVGGDTKREALLAEQNVSAVCGVDRPNGIVFGEMADITVLLVDVGTCVQTLNEVVAVAERLKDVLADTGHDDHVQNDIDRIGKLNAVLREIRADDRHRIRNDIHGLSFVGARKELRELRIALLRLHPVIDVARVFLLSRADEGTVLHTCDVVDRRSVKIAVREFFFIQFNQLAGRECLLTQSLRLLFRAVDQNDVGGFYHIRHLGDPRIDELIGCHIGIHNAFSFFYCRTSLRKAQLLTYTIISYFLFFCKNSEKIF